MGYPLICMMQTFTGPDFTQLPGGLFSPSEIWKKLSRQQEHIIPPSFIAIFSIAQSLSRNFLLFSTVKTISALKHILFLSKNQTISEWNFQFWSTVRGKIKTEIALMCSMLQTYKHQVQLLNGPGKKCCKNL